MPELVPQERLQPSLLDRITDHEPEKTQESRTARVLSLKQLRECVLRDMSWLLNTDCLGTTADLEDYPEVARSVLNYGMPNLSGQLASSVDRLSMERAIRQAIVDFEPRLLKQSVQVRASVNEELMSHNVLTLEIEADLWAEPIPIQLFLKTNVDLESGTVSLSDSGSPR